MGINSIFQSEEQKIFQKYQRRFTIIPQILAPEQSTPKIYYLHEKLSAHKYLLRLLISEDQIESQVFEQMIIKKLSNTSQEETHHASSLSVRLIPIKEYHKIDGCGHSKFYILFDLGELQSLSDYLTLNQVRKNSDSHQRMSEEKLLGNLIELVRSLQMLKYLGHSHPKISTETVYINENGYYFLSDPWMISKIESSSNFFNLRQKEQYRSPQSFSLRNSEERKYDEYISSIFSIGLIGLKSLLLLRREVDMNIEDCYDSRRRKVNQKKIRSKIDLFKNQELRQFLYRLLGPIEERIQVFNEKVQLRQIPIKDSTPFNTASKSYNPESSINQHYSVNFSVFDRQSPQRVSLVRPDYPPQKNTDSIESPSAFKINNPLGTDYTKFVWNDQPVLDI